MKHFAKWFKAHKLSLNVAKTNYIIITNKKGQNKIEIYIENERIEEVKETKFLGVIADNQLSWESHIAVVESKVSKKYWYTVTGKR